MLAFFGRPITGLFSKGQDILAITRSQSPVLPHNLRAQLLRPASFCPGRRSRSITVPDPPLVLKVLGLLAELSAPCSVAQRIQQMITAAS